MAVESDIDTLRATMGDLAQSQMNFNRAMQETLGLIQNQLHTLLQRATTNVEPKDVYQAIRDLNVIRGQVDENTNTMQQLKKTLAPVA